MQAPGSGAFHTRLGFDANPFAQWDADLEERLPDYFVPPPYFDAVFGSAADPTSTIAFAPRGGGKSAQRRMVELSADPIGILVISHVQFPFLSHRSPGDVTLDDHLRTIVGYTVVGLLGRFATNQSSVGRLSDQDRTSLQALSHLYLDEFSRVDLEQSLDALRNTGDRVRAFYNTLVWGYNTLGRSALSSVGIPSPELPAIAEMGREIRPNPFTDLTVLGRVCANVGLDAIYVLVDRIDEASSTSNDSRLAYKMIKPLVEDLRILGLRPFCFKFFIPDTVRILHAASGRPDRVPHFDLAWRAEEIDQMLSKRLSAFSDGRITSLAQILEQDEALLGSLRRT